MPKIKKPCFCWQNLQKAKKLCHIFCTSLCPALQNAHPCGMHFFCQADPDRTNKKFATIFLNVFCSICPLQASKRKGKFTRDKISKVFSLPLPLPKHVTLTNSNKEEKKINPNRPAHKVKMAVEPPYEMVSEYRSGRGMQKKGIEAGTGLIEKDEEGMSPLVLTCRKLLDEVRTFFEE